MATDQFCPLAKVQQMMFRIDPAAPEQVVAVERINGRIWSVSWSEGFQGGSAGDPVVRDPAGQIVAQTGDVLDFSSGVPKLHGYRVCRGVELYVFLDWPS